MRTLPLLFAAALIAAPAFAQDDHSHGTAATAAAASGDHMQMAMDEFMASMKKMDAAMMEAKGATVDETFARKMIAHHQGAIDMAQIELKHGSDAEAKKMAQKTIDENTKGIAELQAWIDKHKAQ